MSDSLVRIARIRFDRPKKCFSGDNNGHLVTVVEIMATQNILDLSRTGDILRSLLNPIAALVTVHGNPN